MTYRYEDIGGYSRSFWNGFDNIEPKRCPEHNEIMRGSMFDDLKLCPLCEFEKLQESGDRNSSSGMRKQTRSEIPPTRKRDVVERGVINSCSPREVQRRIDTSGALY